MAKKYHVDEQGKITPCSAFLRKCLKTDYNTEREAQLAFYRQQEEKQLTEARAQVERIMSDLNAPSVFINADFSGDGHGKDIREFAQQIDENFLEKGEYPQKVYATVSLNRKYINNKNNPISLSLNRIPTADYENGTIKGKWTLETEIKKHDKVAPIVLDLENDYEEEKERAERYIRDVVRRTTPHSLDSKYIEYETNHMINQLEDAFSQIEEEASNPYQVWEKNPGIGTFAGSDMSNINVDVNYNTTLFRGRTFDRFLNDENGYFTSISPDLNIQVYDNENGTSETSWRIVRYNAEWFLQTVDKNGQINPQKLQNAEDGYQKMLNFVINHMQTNDSKTAERKAKYVSTLMTEVEQAIVKNGEIKDIRQGRIHT